MLSKGPERLGKRFYVHGQTAMLKSTLVMVGAVLAAALVGSILIEHLAPASVRTPQPDVIAVVAAAPLAAHATAVPKSADGHFWVEARANDKAVKFLVDTGASVVALTPLDAQRLGFDIRTLDYSRAVNTANGKTLAAEVTIHSLSVGESRVNEVRAMVIREGLDTSLLGMSYLGRLSRIEATPSSLILHP